jgi:hypothetical protein
MTGACTQGFLFLVAPRVVPALATTPTETTTTTQTRQAATNASQRVHQPPLPGNPRGAYLHRNAIAPVCVHAKFSLVFSAQEWGRGAS